MTLSKRQQKIEANKAKQVEFLKARERYNMAVFMQAHELGKKFFEESKEKLTDGEIAMLEDQMNENQKMIDDYLKREGLYAEPDSEAPGLPDTEVSS
jgi:hypothetical protein